MLQSEALTAETLAHADCVAILTDHQSVDYELVRRSARLIVDTRNTIQGAHQAIFKLGSPRQSVEDRQDARAEVA